MPLGNDDIFRWNGDINPGLTTRQAKRIFNNMLKEQWTQVASKKEKQKKKQKEKKTNASATRRNPRPNPRANSHPGARQLLPRMDWPRSTSVGSIPEWYFTKTPSTLDNLRERKKIQDKIRRKIRIFYNKSNKVDPKIRDHAIQMIFGDVLHTLNQP